MIINNFKRIFLSNKIVYNFPVVKFNLPDLGEKIKEGTIKKLYVSEGQQVAEFQKIADVASDKQFTQITASNQGIIKKIHYKEDDICQVGDLFMEIQTKEGDNPQSSTPKKDPPIIDTKSKKEEVKNSSVVSESVKGEFLATPYIRGLLKQHKIDGLNIKGSGENGRILENDIQKYLQKSKKPKEQVKIPSQKSVQTIQMNNFEKGMQKSMTESCKIPHLYLHEEFDITETEKMRKTIKNSNQKVTLMGILIKTFSLALRKYPKMNAIYQPHKNQFEYTLNSQHNISIAIDSPNGLVVPNIKSVNKLSLGQIQSELQRLRKMAEQAKLTSKQLGYGTVCLSNIGTIAGTHACPLILPPQVCIVAIGKMQVLPKYLKGDVLVARSMINVSYGCDHRVIDGATVARFSNQWKRILENPYLALAEMS